MIQFSQLLGKEYDLLLDLIGTVCPHTAWFQADCWASKLTGNEFAAYNQRYNAIPIVSCHPYDYDSCMQNIKPSEPISSVSIKFDCGDIPYSWEDPGMSLSM